MDPDLALVLGLVIGVLSVPAILSALSDRRAPRAPAVTILVAATLIVYAVAKTPGGYSMGELPTIFRNVLSLYVF